MAVSNYNEVPINLNRFEMELQDFYKQVLLKMNLKHVKNLFVLESNKKRSKSISKVPLPKPVHFFKYGSCYISAIAKYFLPLMTNSLFQDCLQKRRINLFCFGGGSAFETVAISKLLASTLDLTPKNPLHLQVTVVEKQQEWKIIAKNVIQVLKETNCLFDPATMNITLKFVCADLSKPMTEDVKEALKEANIITMVKFISEIRNQLPSNGIPGLMQDIAINMKTNAILFYLDIGINRLLRAVHNALRIFKDFKNVAEVTETEPFMLNTDTISRYIELFWTDFHFNLCMTNTVFSSWAWVKLEQLAVKRSEKSARNLLCDESQFNEKKNKCEAALEDFRKKLYPLIHNRKKRKDLKLGNIPGINKYVKSNYLSESKAKNKRIKLQEK